MDWVDWYLTECKKIEEREAMKHHNNIITASIVCGLLAAAVCVITILAFNVEQSNTVNSNVKIPSEIVEKYFGSEWVECEVQEVVEEALEQYFANGE